MFEILIKKISLLFKKVLHFFGLDKSIFFTISGRVLQASFSLVSIFLISIFLTKEEQGFYYTFSSIAALQIFFELGLSMVISQFVAHEFVHLTFDQKKNQFIGDHKHVARLSSLLRFITKWYKYAALLLFTIVTPIGFYFFYFNKLNSNVTWEIAWIILMISTCLYLFISPYISFVEATGKIKEVAKFRLNQTIISNSILFIFFITGNALYGLGFYILSNFFLSFFGYLLPKYADFFILLWNNFSNDIEVNWRTEIWPFQWKIAVSWLGGYLVFQLFNPLLFAYAGPIAAGQMGITLAAINGINGIAMAWMTTKMPTFSGLIAKKEFKSLDNLFYKTFWQSFMVISFLMSLFLILIIFGKYYYFINNIISRFLPITELLFVVLASVANQIIFSFAIYLRSHKKEPLMWLSIVGGLLTSISSFFVVKEYGVYGLTLNFFILTSFVSLPWASYIFYTKKQQWH